MFRTNKMFKCISEYRSSMKYNKGSFKLEDKEKILNTLKIE